MPSDTPEDRDTPSVPNEADPTQILGPRRAAWSEEEDLVGRTISQYTILARLGEGGMGVVYKAQDTRLNRTVALKFLSPQLLADKDAKQRFLHEAQAAAGLDDPHICTVHEIHEAGGHTFIVMNYVEGQSLQEKIASGPLEIGEALDIASQIGRGLSRAHHQGIVHRDIKPGNVLLTSEGQAKIVDFGLAKLASQTQLTRTGTTMGTVAYMSPEQAKAEEVDRRTDIWALGVVLHEMLTGELPFKGDNQQAVIHSILKKRPREISGTRKDVTIGVERLVDRALAKNPGKRYADVDRMLDDLAAESRAVELAEGPGRFVGVQRLLRKRPVLYGVVGMVVAAALAIGILQYQARVSAVHSLAVLPFANLSGDPGQEYFADGMTDALITELYKVSSLTVMSRQSVMRYKDTEKTLPEIARELNVDALVEASAEQEGGRVHIAARLVRAHPERQMWAQSYDRDLSDVVSIHSEVAQAIVSQIQVALTSQERALLTHVYKVNPEAYDALLQGRHYLFSYAPSDPEYKEALPHIREALEIDPKYASAWSALAEYYTDPLVLGSRPSQETAPKAKAAVAMALELDETLPDAHRALAKLMYMYEWDWQAADREFRRALELNPNDPATHWGYSMYLVLAGRGEEGVAEMRRARRMDALPGDDPWILYLAGKDEEAIPLFKYPFLRALSYARAQMYPEALAICDSLAATAGRPNIPCAWVYGVSGAPEKARRILDETLTLSETEYVDPENIAFIYEGLGDVDSTLAWLERAYEEHSPTMFFVKADFVNLAHEPAFQEFLRRVGFPME